MGEEIKIKNPVEVKSAIRRCVAILSVYQDLLTEDVSQLKQVNAIIEETGKAIEQSRRGVESSYMKAKSMQHQSEAARRAMEQNNKLLKNLDNNQRVVQQCATDFIRIRQDHTSLIRESAALLDEGKILSSKIGTLIDKIMEAI